MNKESFNKYIKDELKLNSINNQIKTLDKISHKWIPDLIYELMTNYTYCEHCKKYSKTSNFIKHSEIKNIIEPTYTDSGYGDNDMYGENQYCHEYIECPLCHKETFVRNSYIKNLWEKDCK